MRIRQKQLVAIIRFRSLRSFFELVGDYAKVGYAHFNILSGHGYAQKSWYRMWVKRMKLRCPTSLAHTGISIPMTVPCDSVFGRRTKGTYYQT